MTGPFTLKFTSTESFMLFYEGLRSLQIFRDSNNDAAELEKGVEELDHAASSLQRCTELYPQDALPLYYLGVVRSLQAQMNVETEQTARQAVNIFTRLMTEG